MPVLRKYRFITMRRIVQFSVMGFFIGGSMLDWPALRGNLSTSRLFDILSLADPFAVLQVIASGRMVASEAIIGSLIVLFFFGLFAGRAFCSWICPLNIVTDGADWLREKTGLDSAVKSFSFNRNARYWAIGVTLVVSLITGVAAFEWISPISMLHRGIIFGMGTGWVIVFSVFIFDLLLVKHGFCGHICPLGAFYSLVTRFSLLRVMHAKDSCTLCMKCLKICPEQQVLPMIGERSGAVRSGECTNCGRCIEVCNFGAMKFGLRFFLVKHKTGVV